MPTSFDPSRTRVAIVGAGPAGLAIADRLKHHGYAHVRVFEAEAEPGGKCLSAQIRGRPYELGAVTLFDAYVRAMRLVKRLNVPLIPFDAWTCTPSQRREVRLSSQEEPDWFFRLADAVRTDTGGTSDLGWESAMRAGLHIPTYEWLTKHGLLPVPRRALYMYVSCGYGFFEHEIPAIYFIRTMMVCAGSCHTIVGGMQSIWRRLAADLTDRTGLELSTDTRVTRVERGTEVSIETSKGRFEADVLVWAAGAPEALDVLDVTESERRALSSMRFIDYLVLAIEVDGLSEARNRLITIEPHQVHATRGHVTFFLRSEIDRPIYLTWQYADGRSDEELEETAKADLTALGGDVRRILQRKRWRRYFPHFGSEDIARGLPLSLEQEPRARNTFFAGATLSMELVEWAMRHGEDLVAQSFAP
ncbi:FAD-dependent oxidoreductase [Myxococcota bacterium]|nr:FAD-dependent oxidoreductase [Myxococcota bacterium]